ncbi:extracellular matrix regulator RemB [Gorillibacterium massiliense]|uniref:extracellular matrix regulator RemB n=1 Tax=Gorillibacterium massiliense TaxID=1280390 RepID=UPI0004BCBC38|nr:extracellular matrix/biofilm biosynthesis regulator RemA family protein [Gorillibacterium massiliense]
MFIHLGGDKIIRSSELIAIFDLSIEENSKISKQFVYEAARENKVEIIGEEESKSMVVTVDKVYYSPISTSTLKKRSVSLQVN